MSGWPCLVRHWYHSARSQLSHSLFSLLPSGKRYRTIRCHSTRLQSGFIPQAGRLLSSSSTQQNRTQLRLQRWFRESFTKCGSTVWFSFNYQSVVSSWWCCSFLFGHGHIIKPRTSFEPTQAVFWPLTLHINLPFTNVKAFLSWLKIVYHQMFYIWWYTVSVVSLFYMKRNTLIQSDNCCWVYVDIVALTFLQLHNVTFMPTHVYLTEKVPVFPWCGEGPKNNNLHSSPSEPLYTTDYTSLSWTHPRSV